MDMSNQLSLTKKEVALELGRKSTEIKDFYLVKRISSTKTSFYISFTTPPSGQIYTLVKRDLSFLNKNKQAIIKKQELLLNEEFKFELVRNLVKSITGFVLARSDIGVIHREKNYLVVALDSNSMRFLGSFKIQILD